MSELEPITREEQYLGHMTGLCDSMPDPITREERLLSELCRCVKSEVNYPKDPEGRIDYGEEGQILASNGAGGVVWADLPWVSEWKQSIIGILEGNMAEPLLPRELSAINSRAFYGNTVVAYTSLPDAITYIGTGAFSGCTSLGLVKLPKSLDTLGNASFRGCTGLTELTFQSKPTFISINAFSVCDNLVTINVPWNEGEVANAPWGATNATINYNYE